MPTDSDDAVQTMDPIDECCEAIELEPRAGTRNAADTHGR